MAMKSTKTQAKASVGLKGAAASSKATKAKKLGAAHVKKKLAPPFASKKSGY